MNSPFLKAIWAGLATLIGVGVAYAVSGELDRGELAVGVTGVIGTGLVYFTTNVPGWPFLKALVPALAGSVAALGLYIDSGVLDKGALQTLLTALGLAAAAYVAGNSSSATVQVNEYGSEV